MLSPLGFRTCMHVTCQLRPRKTWNRRQRESPKCCRTPGAHLVSSCPEVTQRTVMRSRKSYVLCLETSTKMHCHFGCSAGTSGPSEVLPTFARFSLISMETVANILQPREDRDSDQEWEKLRQEGAIARATLLHNLQVHEDAEVNSVLSSLSQVDVDDAPLFEKLKEANLVMQGDDPVKVVEIAKDTDMQGSPS